MTISLENTNKYLINADSLSRTDQRHNLTQIQLGKPINLLDLFTELRPRGYLQEHRWIQKSHTHHCKILANTDDDTRPQPLHANETVTLYILSSTARLFATGKELQILESSGEKGYPPYLPSLAPPSMSEPQQTPPLLNVSSWSSQLLWWR